MNSCPNAPKPTDRPRRRAPAMSGAERVCLGIGLTGAAIALAVSLAQAALPPLATTPADLMQAAARAGPGAGACPDGWAAAQAASSGLTEAELTAWYLRDALTLDDATVIAGVGAILSHPAGPVGPRARILLCIAQTRRMIAIDA